LSASDFLEVEGYAARHRPLKRLAMGLEFL